MMRDVSTRHARQSLNLLERVHAYNQSCVPGQAALRRRFSSARHVQCRSRVRCIVSAVRVLVRSLPHFLRICKNKCICLVHACVYMRMSAWLSALVLLRAARFLPCSFRFSGECLMCVYTYVHAYTHIKMHVNALESKRTHANTSCHAHNIM